MGQVYAAESQNNGDYLKYKESKPVTSSSWLSTIAYIFTLVLTFGFVIGLAYFASRFLGHKFGTLSPAGDNKVLKTIPLGQSRAIYVVEVAGKFLIMGVTDHNINLLQEITSAEEIEKIKADSASAPAHQFDRVFQRHLASLQQMSQKFPIAFDAHKKSESQSANEREKR
jgi:flagellar protein FliO/FliZ